MSTLSDVLALAADYPPVTKVTLSQTSVALIFFSESILREIHNWRDNSGFPVDETDIPQIYALIDALMEEMMSATGDQVAVTQTDPQPSFLVDAMEAGNNIALTVTTTPDGDQKLRVDTQGLVHLMNSELSPASPGTLILATLNAGALLAFVDVVVSTPFDGGATLQVGTLAASNLFMDTNENDLSFASAYNAAPAYKAPAQVQIFATFSGGATVGAARIVLTIQE